MLVELKNPQGLFAGVVGGDFFAKKCDEELPLWKPGMRRSTHCNITGLLKSLVLNTGENFGGEECDCLS